MRRLAILSLAVLALAACGGGEETRPLPETVEGEVTQEQLQGDAEKGKALFASQGCGGCHEFAAADSAGGVGPSFDGDLESHAGDAGQDLEQYVKSSLVTPNTYVVSGYDEGVMPSYASLDQQEIADLVAFVTENQ